MSSSLTEDIQAFEAQRNTLEIEHLGEWVVFYDKQLQGFFSDFQTAANDAVTRFGRGPYLIRQVGAPPITLPASVMYGAAFG
jgi:hypothetical protein